MTKKIILSLIVLFCLSGVLRAEEYGVFSPDKKLEVRLRVDGQTMFEVWYNREIGCRKAPFYNGANVCFILWLVFEAGSHGAQAGLELPM